MRVVFVERPNGPERLVTEVEIVFDEDGPLAGLKLVGLSIWKGADDALAVTFPARSFGVGGERRFFDYLRAVEPGAGDPRRVKDWIVDEYRAQAAAA